MESAERKGLLFRRLLLSADRFKDAAIRFGSRELKTPLSRVRASLCSVTCRDQRRPFRGAPLRRAPWRLRLALPLDAAVSLAIAPPRRMCLSSRLNASALPLSRGSLPRPPAALSRREMHEVPGNRCQ